MKEDPRPSLWRFDAWDSRAGLAFASYRPMDDYVQEQLNIDIPTVFLSPPNFRPEQLESRAMALAACRHSFQQGLFHEERELGFGELSELIEQVRRAYVAGSVIDHGDDGGGGNTQTPPVPPPDGESGDGDNAYYPPESESSELREQLEGLVNGFVSQVRELGAGDGIDETGRVPSARFEWAAILGVEPSRGDDLPGRGGLWIASELLARYQFGGGEPDYYQWAEASGRFARACGTLRLWKSWSMNGEISGLLRAFPRLLRKVSGASPLVNEVNHDVLNGDERAACHLLWWLLVPEDRDESGWFYYYHPFRSSFPFVENDYRTDAPLQDLGYWPVPKGLGHLANPNYPRRASVADLLATFLASPQKFSDAGKWELWATIEICFFAAAYLTDRDSAVPITIATDQRALWHPRNFAHHDPAMALRKSWRWLSQQLPKVAFVPEVERIISEASTLSYRGQEVANSTADA